MLNGVLLPAMMLVPANPALAYEAWDALRLFPYQRRFRFYHALQARLFCISSHELQSTSRYQDVRCALCFEM